MATKRDKIFPADMAVTKLDMKLNDAEMDQFEALKVFWAQLFDLLYNTTLEGVSKRRDLGIEGAHRNFQAMLEDNILLRSLVCVKDPSQIFDFISEVVAAKTTETGWMALVKKALSVNKGDDGVLSLIKSEILEPLQQEFRLMDGDFTELGRRINLFKPLTINTNAKAGMYSLALELHKWFRVEDVTTLLVERRDEKTEAVLKALFRR